MNDTFRAAPESNTPFVPDLAGSGSGSPTYSTDIPFDNVTTTVTHNLGTLGVGS